MDRIRDQAIITDTDHNHDGASALPARTITRVRRATAERDGIFALAVLTLGVVTVFILAQFGAAFATSDPRAATSGQSASVGRATSTTSGVIPARVHIFPVPDQEAGLMQPALAPDGSVWFGEMGRNRLARLDPATGKVTSWLPPDGKFGIMAAAVAPDGAVWFTEQSANYIGRFDPRQQQFTRYALPVKAGRPAAPQDIALDATGHVWFTEVTAGAIGRLDPATGAIQHWPVPPTTPDTPVYPYGIALTADGAVWFSELSDGTIGRLDPATGAIRLFRTPAGDAQIFSLAAAPDGSLWFTELQYGKLGVLDPHTGAVRELAIPSPVSTTPNVYDVAVASDGAVWVAAMGQNAVASYVPRTGAFTLHELPDANTIPYGLALDSAGRVWFTADRSPINYVGLLTP